LKQKIKIVGLIILLIIGFALSNGKHNTKVEQKISQITKDNTRKSINVKNITSFAWDKAFLFGPYTSQEKINKQLGVTFKDPSDIRKRDDIFLLVFLKDGKIVQYSEIKRQSCDFYINHGNHLTPLSSTIKIKRYN